MIKASVIYDGAHKWAQHKLLKPVDYGFIFRRIFELFWVVFTGAYILFILSFSIIFASLQKTLILMCALEVFWIWDFISAFLKKNKAKKKILSEKPDGCQREFTINDNGIFLDYKSDEEWGSAMIRFEGVTSAAETKEFFAFAIDKKRPYSIAKSEITEGSAEELSALFQEKLGGRFRRRVK